MVAARREQSQTASDHTGGTHGGKAGFTFLGSPACFWFVRYQGWTPDLTVPGEHTPVGLRKYEAGQGLFQFSSPHHRHGQVLSDMTFFTSRC